MNAAATFARAIKKAVYANQKDLAKDLVGKHVRRNGTIFLVVDVTREKVIASATGTDIEQVNTFNRKSFLSKGITVIEDAE